MRLECFGKIVSVNLRHNFLPHFGAAALITALAPIVFNVSALNGMEAAQPVERLLPWVGVILLTPVFLPEQNEEIRDVVRSKKTNYFLVCAIRVIYSVLSVMALVGLFLGVMKCCESEVTCYHFLGGTASALFLGAVGFAFAGISGNVTVGYMAAMLYYLANYGLKKKLGMFFLFSMSAGSFREKYFLLGAFAVLVLITFGTLWLKER